MHRIDHPCAEVRWIYSSIEQTLLARSCALGTGQNFVSTIAEWTEVQMPPAVIDQEYCMMYFDGSLMKKGAGIGLVFMSPLGVRMRYMVCLHFPSSNNMA